MQLSVSARFGAISVDVVQLGLQVCSASGLLNNILGVGNLASIMLNDHKHQHKDKKNCESNE